MDGLECSEILISQVRQYEPFRIDSHFFEKQYRELKETLATLPCTQLKDLVTKAIQTGHTPSMAVDSYYGGSIALIKTDNLHDNSIGTIFSDYLTADGNAVISRTSLATRDIITTIIGATEQIIARSAIVTEEYLPANINQNIVQIRINPKKATPEYVNTYLNTKYGKQYLIYLSRQTEQYNLNCKEVESLIIPLFSDAFQKEVARVVEKASTHQLSSRALYRKASEELDEVLSVHIEEQKMPVFSIVNISESFLKTGRIDAEYYQPKYDRLFDLISAFNTTVIPSEFNVFRNSGTDYTEGVSEVGVIKTKQLSDNRVDIDGVESYFDLATCIENKSTILKNGDVVFASMGVGSLGKASLFLSDEEKQYVTDSTLRIYRAKPSTRVLPEVLCTYLQSAIGQELIYRYVVGSTGIISIYDADMAKIPIPILDGEVQEEIATKVQDSFALRRKSKELLEYAKQAVEMAIEQGEDVALEWLILKA